MRVTEINKTWLLTILFFLEHNYHKLLRKLDDSLFRYKELKRNTIQNTNVKENRSLTDRTQNRISASRFDANNDEWIETNKPNNDKSCKINYPIKCVSNNWEIIRCYVFLHPLAKDDKNERKQSEEELSGQLEVCSDFKVHLEHFRYICFAASRHFLSIKNL